MRLELSLSGDSLDELAQEMSRGFALDGKDMVEGYPLAPPPPPGECKPRWFHNYVRGHVYLGVEGFVRERAAQPEELEKSIGFLEWKKVTSRVRSAEKLDLRAKAPTEI